jgi:hypothetical protein
MKKFHLRLVVSVRLAVVENKIFIKLFAAASEADFDAAKFFVIFLAVSPS